MLYLGSIEMGHVISGPCYNLKGTILQRNNRKMTIIWSFSYYYFVKFHGKKLSEPQNDHDFLLYQNPCYNEVCCKGTALYFIKLTIRMERYGMETNFRRSHIEIFIKLHIQCKCTP